jgi:hypothetical protein
MHRCAAGRSCRDPVIDGDTRAPALIAEPRGLCRRCLGAVNAAVSMLEADYRELGDAIGERAVSLGDRVSGTPTPPIPLNTATDALARSIAEWADAAVAVVAAALAIDHPVPYRGRGFPRRDLAVIQAAGRIVAPNVDLLLAAPVEPVLVWDGDGSGRHLIDADGIDIALAMVRNHRQVIAALGDPNPRERLAMPCPVFDCGAATLGRNNGSTDVTCTTCGGRWTEREYAWLAGLLIADKREDDAMAETYAEAVLARQLAEARLAEANSKLDKLRQVGKWTPDDVCRCSAMDIVTLVAELTD